MDKTNELVLFLKNAKVVATTNPVTSKFHVVIGNESADLDSFVSAIVYAFYLWKKDVEHYEHYIPVIATHRDDLVLRTEVIALLSKLGISKDDVIHLNDVNLASLHVSKVTLVDHNNCGPYLTGFSQFVYQIIDHHEDSQEFDVPKNIKTVGSCATLITEEIYYFDSSILSIYPIADLLLSAVLIDTYNLNLHSGRTTELDIFMGGILTNHTTEDPDQFFDYLQRAKTDISSMGTFDVLRKDYKAVSTSTSFKMGISSVMLNSLCVVQRDDFIEATENYMSKIQINVLVIMFLSFKEESTSPFREIAVFSKEVTHLETVSSYLMSFKDDLKLFERSDDVPDSLKKFVRLYDQEPKLSRKFVLPILQRLHTKDS